MFRTILADPPWRFRSAHPACKAPYPTLGIEHILAMSEQVQRLAAKDAHLYLWSTHAHLREALEVMEAWGFRYIQVLTWDKRRMGFGYYFRHYTEPLLFGVRGNLRVIPRNLPSLFSETRTQHSKKPEASYLLIEKSSPGPRLELFARQRRAGWKVWGNEVDSDIELVIPGMEGGMAA